VSDAATPLSIVPDPSEMDLKQKQAAYHDWEAASYEDKFSISYDQRCIDYAVERLRKVVPEGARFGRVLEVGAGTGFFTINLALGGALPGAALEASDISQGMLDVCAANGREHGLQITTTQGDAEDLPYEDDAFDLVIGHAFIHHLPVPGKALQEMHRVLAPGGTLVIAGEPTHYGDRLSHVVKHNTWRAFRAVTALPGLARFRATDGAGSAAEARDQVLAALEDQVDLHTFRPDDVEHMAHLAGFAHVEVVTEELAANWFGWSVRTIEASIRPGVLGMRWAYFAFDNYKRLTALDEKLLRRFVPRGLFYNLILHARKAR
jgi:ubiquinone/menaquinone biosynthesis C-methylase UbiE